MKSEFDRELGRTGLRVQSRFMAPGVMTRFHPASRAFHGALSSRPSFLITRWFDRPHSFGSGGEIEWLRSPGYSQHAARRTTAHPLAGGFAQDAAGNTPQPGHAYKSFPEPQFTVRRKPAMNIPRPFQKGGRPGDLSRATVTGPSSGEPATGAYSTAADGIQRAEEPTGTRSSTEIALAGPASVGTPSSISTPVAPRVPGGSQPTESAIHGMVARQLESGTGSPSVVSHEIHAAAPPLVSLSKIMPQMHGGSDPGGPPMHSAGHQPGSAGVLPPIVSPRIHPAATVSALQLVSLPETMPQIPGGSHPGVPPLPGAGAGLSPVVSPGIHTAAHESPSPPLVKETMPPVQGSGSMPYGAEIARSVLRTVLPPAVSPGIHSEAAVSVPLPLVTLPQAMPMPGSNPRPSGSQLDRASIPPSAISSTGSLGLGSNLLDSASSGSQALPDVRPPASALQHPDIRRPEISRAADAPRIAPSPADPSYSATGSPGSPPAAPGFNADPPGTSGHELIGPNMTASGIVTAAPSGTLGRMADVRGPLAAGFPLVDAAPLLASEMSPSVTPAVSIQREASHELAGEPANALVPPGRETAGVPSAMLADRIQPAGPGSIQTATVRGESMALGGIARTPLVLATGPTDAPAGVSKPSPSQAVTMPSALPNTAHRAAGPVVSRLAEARQSESWAETLSLPMAGRPAMRTSATPGPFLSTRLEPIARGRGLESAVQFQRLRSESSSDATLPVLTVPSGPAIHPQTASTDRSSGSPQIQRAWEPESGAGFPNRAAGSSGTTFLPPAHRVIIARSTDEAFGQAAGWMPFSTVLPANSPLARSGAVMRDRVANASAETRSAISLERGTTPVVLPSARPSTLSPPGVVARAFFASTKPSAARSRNSESLLLRRVTEEALQPTMPLTASFHRENFRGVVPPTGSPVHTFAQRAAAHGMELPLPLLFSAGANEGPASSMNMADSQIPLSPAAFAGTSPIRPGISRSRAPAANSSNGLQRSSTGMDSLISRAAEPAAATGRPAAGNDPDELIEKVIRVILDRLAIESERRGWRQWT